MRKHATGLEHATLGWRRFSRNDQVILAILAVVIGTVVALGAIGFREILGLVQKIGFGFSTEDVFTRVADLPWWQILLVPTVGGLLVGIFIYRFMPGRRPQGVADVIEAGALHGGRLSFNTALKGALVNSASLGFGASTGREGPMVHLGGAFASYIARRAHLNPSLALTLLGCGVAAGVAASFNAPIAGVFFALEVVIGHYALHAFAPVVIAAVAGTVVSRLYYGPFPAFTVPEYSIGSPFEYFGFFALGLIAAGVAVFFLRTVAAVEAIAEKSNAPVWIRPAVAGFLVGLIALAFPQVLGVGYEATDTALQGGFGLWLLVGLVIAKTVATAISFGGRFGGGVFSPSLVVGAMAGGAMGMVMSGLFPGAVSEPGFYAMIGMGAVAAPVLGAPMSTILIVFELTGEVSLMVAAMIAIVVSSVITQHFFGKSFFHWQLQKRGLNLRGGRIEHLLKSKHVADIMTQDFDTIPEGATIEQIRSILESSSHGDFFVVGRDGELVGTITFADIKAVAFDPTLNQLVNARDIARLHPAVLRPSDDLENALKVMDGSGEGSLPVVEDDQTMRVLGIVQHRDALVAYNRALMQAREEEHDEGHRYRRR